MAYEQRDMSGSLFDNDKKTTDKHPDYTGTAKINGDEFYVSAWTKVTKNGYEFFSLSFKPKTGAPQTKSHTGRRQATREPPITDDGFDTEIPF